MKASEAREISDKRNPQKAVEKILTQVKDQAENGQYTVKIRDWGFGDSVMYSSSHRNFSSHQQKIDKGLRDLGYKTELKVDERQFTDIYLEVSWGEA